MRQKIIHNSISNVLLGIAIFLVSVIFLSGGCTPARGEGFAIYLTEEDIPPDRMEALSHVDIAEQPIIATKDVITYNAQTHEIKLTSSAFERISQLDVPVRGKPFIVCVDRNPIYWGAFWTPLSSMAFGGVTVWKPLGFQESEIITLELGYPSPSFYQGKDPRNNTEVIRSLEEAGKLIDKLSITEVNRLPHSPKGYELYSWKEENLWHFTLITGTNRNKTLEEIVSEEDFISETGWVKANLSGIYSVKDALSRLPQKEYVVWLDGMRLEQESQVRANIMLPDEAVIETVKKAAALYSLDFVIIPAT